MDTERLPRGLSIPEFARALGVSDRLAYEMARTGRIPGAIRFGSRRWVIPARVLTEMLGEADAPAPPVAV